MSSGDLTQQQLEDETIGLALTPDPRNLRDLIAAHVRPEHFSNPVHAETWKLIQKLDAENEPVDPMTVYAARAQADKLAAKQIKGPWLTSLLTAAPEWYAATNRAKLLREAFDRRQTQNVLTRSTQQLEGGIPARDVRLQAMADLQDVSDSDSTLIGLSESMTQTISGFDQVTRYMATPWQKINRIIRGWRPGGLYVIGGRPGGGKSFFLQAAALGLSNYGPVLFEAMEMTHDEVTRRVLAQVSGVSQGYMGGLREDGTSSLHESSRTRILEAQKKIDHLPLVYGHGAYTVTDIREHARQLRARGPLTAIVIDYLQLMNVGYRMDNRVQEITVITRQLKMLAGEFDCPVIVASQLSRAGAGKPELTHFRDSGSIEQDGDVLIGLYTAGEEQNAEGYLDFDAIVLKNRQGPVATATLLRHGPTATITDTERNPLSARKEY